MIGAYDKIREYQAANPDAPQLLDHAHEFGLAKLADMVDEAKGRKIVIEPSPLNDQQTPDASHIVSYE